MFSCLIGTYTSRTASRGIYLLRRGEAWTAEPLLVPCVDPSYLLPVGDDRLYWVEEALCESEGRVALARRDEKGWRRVGDDTTGGVNPCHLAISPDGKWLAAANYTDGSVAVFRLGPSGVPQRTALLPGSGRGVDPQRQENAHAHFVRFARNGEIWCCDLGCDVIRRLVLKDGTWQETAPVIRLPDGCGPRHMVAGPGPLLYVVCELSSELMVCDIAAGSVLARQPCAPGGSAGTGAAIRLGPDGCLYLSHRGADCVSVYALADPAAPALIGMFPCGGQGPRDILPLADGVLCACQASDTVSWLDRRQGLRCTQRLTLPAPVCIA